MPKLFSLLCLCAAFLAAPGASAAPAAADPEVLFEIEVTATAPDGSTQHFDGVWFDTPLAREIAARLPLDVDLHAFGGREYYGGVDFIPENNPGPGQLHFTDGDITFCFENNTMAIFYAQSSRPSLTMEVYPLGRVTSDLEAFHHLPGSMTFSFARKAEDTAALSPSPFGRSLVAYFSRWDNSNQDLAKVNALTMASVLTVDGVTQGTTAFAAAEIARQVQGEVYAVLTSDLLPASDDALIAQNHAEQEQGAVPALKSGAPLDVSGYDTIFVGFPIWAMSVPRALISWLQSLDLEGKQLVLFCTHNGWGAGRARSQIERAVPQAQLLPGILSLDSSRAAQSGPEIRAFLQQLASSL